MPNYFGQTQIILGNSRGDTRLLRCQMRISWRSITRGQTAGGGDRGGTDISGDTVRSRGHQSFGDNAGHPGPASTGWEQDWHTHTSPGVGREAESHLGSFLGWYHTPGMMLLARQLLLLITFNVNQKVLEMRMFFHLRAMLLFTKMGHYR